MAHSMLKEHAMHAGFPKNVKKDNIGHSCVSGVALHFILRRMSITCFVENVRKPS